MRGRRLEQLRRETAWVDPTVQLWNRTFIENIRYGASTDDAPAINRVLKLADLLDVLKITKQSLGRVLKQLIDKGYIVQRAGSVDRRERLLYPTASGRALTKRLAAPQLVRLAEALKAAGPDAEIVVRRFLQAMINAEERPKVSSIMSSSPAPVEDDGKAEVS